MNYYVGGMTVDDVTVEWAGARCMTSSGHATSRDSRPHIAVVAPAANSGRSTSRFSDVTTVKMAPEWNVLVVQVVMRVISCFWCFFVYIYIQLFVLRCPLVVAPVAEDESVC